MSWDISGREVKALNNNVINSTINHEVKSMINSITANDLKVKGVSAINKAISTENEAIITVRGKSKYVVLSLEEYNHLRECELEAALLEAKKDMDEGNVYSGTIEDHIKRITHG
jgi:PHD/YefM family antitoxin component YafN of YafNO toxin-antitoxin module